MKKTTKQYKILLIISLIIIINIRYTLLNYRIILKIVFFPNIKINGSINLSDCQFNIINQYFHWSNLTTSYYQRRPMYAESVVQIFSSAIARELCRLIHIKDVYCNSNKVIALYNKQIIIYSEKNNVKYKTQDLQYHENIIYLFSEWGNVFAHFVHDCLPQLILIPKDIIEKSMIMISFNINISIQYFELLNISKDQILYDNKIWYFTNNLYICYSIEPHNGFNMYSFPKIVDLLRTRLNITTINAYRYVFMNRNKGEKRYIENMNEFYIFTKKEMNHINWENDKLNYTKLNQIAFNFATIKLLVTPSGSHTIYMIFMNRNYTVGICLIQSEWIDLPNYITAYNNEIWMNGFCHSWKHHDNSPHNCSIEIGIRTVSNLYYAITSHKWNEEGEINTIEAFDFEKIKTLTKNNCLATELMYMKNNSVFYYIMKYGWN